MEVRPDIQLKSMIKAMIDVVLPAVDPAHKMAQEQVRLVIGTLKLLENRLPLLYYYDCDELQRYIDFSCKVAANVKDEVFLADIAELENIAERGKKVLEGARSAPAVIEGAAFDLRASVGRLIQEVGRSDCSDTKKKIRELVLQMSKVEQEREIAMVIDMGFEPDQSKHPRPIEVQLAELRNSMN